MASHVWVGALGTVNIKWILNYIDAGRGGSYSWRTANGSTHHISEIWLLTSTGQPQLFHYFWYTVVLIFLACHLRSLKSTMPPIWSQVKGLFQLFRSPSLGATWGCNENGLQQVSGAWQMKEIEIWIHFFPSNKHKKPSNPLSSSQFC